MPLRDIFWECIAQLGLLLSLEWTRTESLGSHALALDYYWRTRALRAFESRAPDEEINRTLRHSYGELPEVLIDTYSPHTSSQFLETPHSWAALYFAIQTPSPSWTTIASEVRWLLTWSGRGPEYFTSKTNLPTSLPRKNHFQYLPKTLTANSTLSLTFLTDIQNDLFLEEFRTAIDQHWNDSPWAKQHQIRFEIEFKHIAESASSDFDLDRHLARFPDSNPAITTGARSPFTRGHVIALSPGKITRATLAHEFGHILGFEDCYYRKREGDAFLGIVITEWLPDGLQTELMCDSLNGRVRSLVW